MATTLKTEVQIVHLQAGRRSSHAPTARVVEPTSGIAPAKGKGNLYILLEIAGEDSAMVARLYRELLNRIQETYYASQGDVIASLTEAIQSAHTFMQAFNRRYNADYVAGVTCLVVASQEVVSAQAGPTILAVRSRAGLQWFSPLNDENYIALGEPETPAVEIGRVAGHAGVVIVAMNSAWANYLEVPLMLEATAVPRARAVADQMAGIGIDAEEELTALVVTLNEAVGTGRDVGLKPEQLPQEAEAATPSIEMPMAPEEAPTPEEAPIEEEVLDWEAVYDMPEEAKPEPASPEKKRRLAGVNKLRRRIPKPKLQTAPRAPARTPQKAKVKPPSRLPFVVAFIIILLVGVGLLTSGMWYYQNMQRQQLLEKFIVGSTTQFNKAKELNDVELQRQSLKFAQEQLKQAKMLAPEDPRVRQLEDQIKNFQAQINKVVGLMAGFDLPLQQFDDPASNPTTVFVNGLSVYVLDSGRGVFERYQLDDATGDRLATGVENPKTLLRTGETVEGRTVGQLAHAIWAPTAGNRTVTSPLIMDQGVQLFGINEGLGPVNVALADNPDLQFVKGLYFYNGNIYLLDSAGGQLWRYRPSGSNYLNTPEPYFPASANVNLKSVIDVGIDGYVWLLYPNGSMLKFLSGEQTPFALEPVDPPLTQAVALWVNSAEGELGRIYIADAATNRVLVFDKNGKFLAQLTPLEHANALADLRDIYVDELTNTLYLLTKQALYLSPLPAIDMTMPLQVP